MLNFDITYNVLTLLSERGIQIYVDDLGTGYADFNYQRNFPVKSLKIAHLCAISPALGAIAELTNPYLQWHMA